MSRSQPTESLVNPTVKYLEWDSEAGNFKYFDKTNKKNITVDLPVKFYALDELATVKGYSDKHQGGIWSNEIKNLSTQSLRVQGRGKDGKGFLIAEGLYGNDKNPGIKSDIIAAGGKYTRSLYAAMLNDKDEYELVNFQLKGAAFGGWLEFREDLKLSMFDVPTDEIVCSSFKQEKKGATKYKVPVFTTEKASEEGNEAAITLDVELQTYLVKYFEKTQGKQQQKEEEVEDNTEEDNGLPF